MAAQVGFWTAVLYFGGAFLIALMLHVWKREPLPIALLIGMVSMGIAASILLLVGWFIVALN